MTMEPEDRAYVVRHATQLLRHEHRGRLFGILAARLDNDDYPDARERRLDAITFAVARAIDEQLQEPPA